MSKDIECFLVIDFKCNAIQGNDWSYSVFCIIQFELWIMKEMLISKWESEVSDMLLICFHQSYV